METIVESIQRIKTFEEAGHALNSLWGNGQPLLDCARAIQLRLLRQGGQLVAVEDGWRVMVEGQDAGLIPVSEAHVLTFSELAGL
jgi:hypothetical protein